LLEESNGGGKNPTVIRGWVATQVNTKSTLLDLNVISTAKWEWGKFGSNMSWNNIACTVDVCQMD
jgi:hypothetical protein